jgi:hypothetical protein
MSRQRSPSLVSLVLLSLGAVCGVSAAGVGCSSPSPSHSRPSTEVVATATQNVTSCDYSVLTAHNDNQRTGLQSCEALLTPVTAPYVEVINAFSVNGTVTGQPLVLHGNRVNGVVQDAVIIASSPTTASIAPTLYFSDPTLSLLIATISLPIPQICNTPRGWCNGILSTPVIDKASNTLYVLNGRMVGGGTVPEYDLIAYDINSMGQLGSVTISGTCSSGEIFRAHDATNALLHQQRPALLLDRGHIYIAFGSANNEGATDAYNGWVFAYNTVQNGLTPAGPAYCVSRAAGPNGWGRGGIWQMGAGPSADSVGNVYVATGNGFIADPARDDGQSYVQLAGVPWTGLLKGKYLNPDYNFLAANEIEGSSGTIVLPGPNQTQRVLGMTKQGMFTVMNPSAMAVPAQGPFRAAWHQYRPMLGDPNPSLREPDAIACNASNGCNASGLPDVNGTQNCCPNGCTCPNGPASCFGGNTYSSCFGLIHGSHPHVHGQPVYLPNGAGSGGTVFWWGEKDYPRYAQWSSQTGTFSQTPTKASNLVSTTDEAPDNPSNDPIHFMMNAMPGGMMSLSSNGTSNAVLWASTTSSTSSAGWPTAFDVARSLPKSHILQIGWSDNAYRAYPTIANGYVYLARATDVAVYSTRPPPAPNWTILPGAARSIGSGWAIGTNSIGNDFVILQWSPATQTWSTASGGGGQTISVDLNGTPWVVNGVGDIYKWTGAPWVWAGYGLGHNPGFASVASGSTDNETWATGTDNTIWHWTGSAWTQVTGIGAGPKVVVFSTPDPTCGDHLPVILGTNSYFYFVGHSGACSTYAPSANWPNGAGPDLTTDFAVGTDGNVYRWGPTGAWSYYVGAPWGLNTKIGAWGEGVYAMSTADGTVQQVVGQY